MKSLLVLALLAAQPAPQPQFDLLCKDGRGVVHYRVDLSAGEWCWDNCDRTRKIVRAEERRIVFTDLDTPSQKAWNWVDRATGEWSQGLDDRRTGYTSHRGVCALAPFSGFPPRLPNKF